MDMVKVKVSQLDERKQLKTIQFNKHKETEHVTNEAIEIDTEIDKESPCEKEKKFVLSSCCFTFNPRHKHGLMFTESGFHSYKGGLQSTVFQEDYCK